MKGSDVESCNALLKLNLELSKKIECRVIFEGLRSNKEIFAWFYRSIWLCL